MMPRPSTIVTAYGLAMLSARMAIAMAPTSTAGITGTRRVPDTDASLSPAGRLLSRPMANRIRTDIAWMARQQTKMASAQSQRKTSPQKSPSTSLVISARPPAPRPAGYSVSLTAIVPNRISRKPMVPAVASACRIARGARLRGSSVSSAREPAESKPYITYSGMIAPTSSAPR